MQRTQRQGISVLVGESAREVARLWPGMKGPTGNVLMWGHIRPWPSPGTQSKLVCPRSAQELDQTPLISAPDPHHFAFCLGIWTSCKWKQAVFILCD